METKIQKENISNLTSLDITHKMGAGWNLGNTLDAHWNARVGDSIKTPKDQETYWGNPVTTKAVIEKIKSSGYDTIRVPVTWYIFTGDDYKIDGAWMNRVQEIVDYVIDSGMFCILNLHHDDYIFGKDDKGFWECGWLKLYDIDLGGKRQPLPDQQKDIFRKRLESLWRQIAERFKDYDEYLIFEGMNEPRTQGMEKITKDEYKEQTIFLNQLNQVFVDMVRKSGGKNADRHLMVTPYWASLGMDAKDGDDRIKFFVDRENKKLFINDDRNRLIVSLHYYEPWGFVTAQNKSPYYSPYFDLNNPYVSANINNVMQILKENFVDCHLPVVMGETGAVHRPLPDGSSNDGERVKWADCYFTKLYELGVPVVYWDDGGHFKLFERRNLEWVNPELAAALAQAAKTPCKY